MSRTSGPPTFSTAQVPTRVNSPSDVAFDSRNSLSGGGLDFTPGIINPSFTALNSILNGIHPMPNQTTGGEGAVTGQEVQFNVSFTNQFSLPAGHYFFVPQVDWAAAISSGFPPQHLLFSPAICRHGSATPISIPIGCGRERILLVAASVHQNSTNHFRSLERFRIPVRPHCFSPLQQGHSSI